MTRWWLVAIVVVACSPRAKEPDNTGVQPVTHDAAPPKTVLEQVQRSLAPGSTASEAAFAVPGIALFQIDDHRPVPQDAQHTVEIVGVVGGVGSPILRGDDVMRAVIKAVQDPAKLAEIALAVNRRPGMILTAPRDDVQRKRGVTAPHRAGDAIELWVLAGSPSLELLFGRLDLASGKLELSPPAIGDDEEIANAAAALETSAMYGALDTLKRNCAKPAASKALFDALAKGKSKELRERTAMAVEACGAAAVEPLIRALESDPEMTVRGTAAIVLGNLRDPRAKPALEKAAKSSDATLAYAAGQALKKLP